MQVNWQTYKFRASSIKKLMTNSRSKTELLSETTKTYLQEVWIKEVYGREKIVSTAPMQKGTIVESDSLDVVQQALGSVFFKNNKKYENEYVSGTPDVVSLKDSLVIDIKSSWDIWTFAKTDQKAATDDYYYQVMTYMWLTGTQNAKLIYTLTNTPEHLMFSEAQKLSYSIGQEEAERITRLNHTYDDIAASKRIKEYSFTYSAETVEAIINKIKLCQEYLAKMEL